MVNCVWLGNVYFRLKRKNKDGRRERDREGDDERERE